MKKVTILLLALLTLFVFSSCYSEPSSLSMVAFTVNNQSRSLEDSFNDLDGMVWRYTALKTDNTVDQTGKEVSPILVGKEGKITSEVGPFSQGNWTFTLYGARTKEESNAGQYAYIGISEVTIKDSKCNVNVKVSPQITDGGIGTLVINKDIKLLDVLNQNIKDGTYDVLIDVKKSDTVSFDTPELKDGVYTYANIPSGAYSVNIKYVAKTNHDVVFGEDTIYSIVFDNLTTTISGSLNAPSETQFVPDADGSIVASTKVQVSATEETEVKVASSPVNPYGKEEGSTTAISFPSGSFTEDKNVVLNIKSYTTSEAGEKFEVTDESTVIAGLAINMTDENGTAITEFNENAATVTTYIAKGLTFENISVVYNGLGDAPEKVSYDSITGKLVFRTTHFSEFYITTIDDIEAINTTINTAYATLDGALETANANDTIVIVKDLVRNTPIAITKSLILDGDNHKVTSNTTANGRGLWVDENDVSLTIKNLIIDGRDNTNGGIFERAVQVNGSKTGVKLLIEDCDLKSTYYAINIMSDVGVTIDIKDSEIVGWGALNLWSAGSHVNVERSILHGINDKPAGWNNFGTVVCEGDTTGKTELHSYDLHIVIKDSTIKSETTTGNVQQSLTFNSLSKNNIIELFNTKFEDIETNGRVIRYLDDGLDNKLFIDGVLTNEPTPLQCWYSNGPYLASNSDAMETSLHKPFENGWMADGEGVRLLKDIIINRDVKVQIESGKIYFDLNQHTVFGGNLVIKNGVGVISDTEGLNTVTSDESLRIVSEDSTTCHIVMTSTDDDRYLYMCEELHNAE